MERQYKDSGIEWIGKIPVTWNLARLKDVKSNKPYAIVDGPFGSAISTNDYKDEGVPLVRIVNLTGKELDPNTTMFISSELAESVQRSSFCLNDIIFAKTGATVGKCSINTSIEYGILSSSCVKISIAKEFLFNYYYYFFSTYQFNLALRLACGGSTRDTINLEPFKNLPCLIPPLPEQQRIVSYLDKKCGEIDALIALQEKMIAQLTDYKQAVITEAVTKGLDPNAKLVPSGIEWIGDVPEGWKVTNISKIAKTNSGSTPPNIVNDDTSNIIWVRTTDIHDDEVYSSSNLLTENEFRNASCPMLEPGTCLVAMYGGAGTIGKCGILKVRATINQALCSMEVKESYYNYYLFYVLQAFRTVWMRFAVGTRKDPNINQEIVKKMLIPLPPLPDQQRIASYLDTKCSEIDSLIALKRQKIESLNAYKKSVIYEAVTGKTII